MIRRLLILLLLPLALAGCGERRDPTHDAETTFTHTRADAVALVVLDLSGSFEQLLLGRDNRAFAFLQKLIQEFFYQGIGREQRLVIAQISGTDKAILFEGSIRDFNERFPDPESFRDHLKRVGNPAGSRVYDSISDALSFTLGLPAVEKGHTKVGLFVLSDFDDNMHTAQSFPRLEAQLKVLANEYQGAVGCYFVEQTLYPQILALVKRCGFPRDRGVVTSEVTTNPPIPTLLR